LLIFILTVTLLFGSFSSTTYDLIPEGESSGRISEGISASYIFSGDAGAFSGGFSSSHYELNNGWHYTANIDALPPCAVGSFGSETLANGNIKLCWGSATDLESSIRGFRVYRSVKQSENGIMLAEIDGAEFTDTTGLIFGINYYYTVKPVDMAGNETVNGNPTVLGVSKSLSTSVTSLTAVSRPLGGVELNWQAPEGLAYYRVYRSLLFGGKGVQVNIDGSTVLGNFSQALSDGLTDGKRYYYTVQGVDSFGNEQQTGNNQASVICDAVPPTVPVISSSSHPDALPCIDNCPVFSWVEAEDPKAPADGASGVKGYYYVLSRSPSESFNNSWSFENTLSMHYENIADGDWYFYAAAEDFAGNRSLAASKKIVIKTSGEVSGKIYDEDGKTPLKDTRLELFSGALLVSSGRTDNAGNYIFTGVPFGSYKIRIYKAGFNPYETELIALSKNITAVIVNKTVNSVQNVGREGAASYPNPCKTGIVTFVYKVDSPGKVIIDIYDAAGEKTATLEESQALTGFRETKWDASSASPGVYFYCVKLESNGSTFRFPVKKLSISR